MSHHESPERDSRRITEGFTVLGDEDEESLREAKKDAERPLRDERPPSVKDGTSGLLPKNSKEDERNSGMDLSPKRMVEDFAIAQRVMDRRREGSREKDGGLDPKGTHGALRRKEKVGKVALGALDPKGTHGALRHEDKDGGVDPKGTHGALRRCP